MWIKRAGIVVGLIAVFAAVAPFVSSSITSEDVSTLITHKVQRGDLSIVVTENGTVESSNNKEIKCFVKGGSTVLWVIETGTFVKEGDELVRLDNSMIEENITQQQIQVERAIANQIIAESEVDVARTNIEEYKNGTYLEERSLIEKEIFDAQERVKKAQLTYDSAERMASKGMFGRLQLDGQAFAVESARKDLELKTQQLETLDKYKRKKTLQGLDSALAAAEARLAAENASLKLEKDRLERDRKQLENCIIRATAEGMVIFPSAAEWKETPDIEEGAMVREQQTLLMIPDVTKMQVKVGIHESKVDQLTIGMPARVQLQGLTIYGEVEEIAEVTRPAGWWTGNMVKYDTLIKLPQREGLKPGMSAVVDVVLNEYTDVVKAPVASIVETNEGFLCWVQTESGIAKRKVELSGSNDEFTVITDGLKEGDVVVLNPLAHIDEAQAEALKPTNRVREQGNIIQDGAGSAKPVAKKDDGNAKKKEKKPASIGAQVIAAADKNKDGFLTEDEVREEDRADFSKGDANGDGKISAAEMDAAIKRERAGESDK